ncbi:uncharacterized protein LOC128169457 [Crassostrea angulata]|uniref:uncharacterized protein LOC128169457 n=1 Tax=Magallana angulata TaxID=2784310 RepID=UPI0022B108A2|nr:uncharacterized protein LOC128169457 [Crassostrea angulata]
MTDNGVTRHTGDCTERKTQQKGWKTNRINPRRVGPIKTPMAPKRDRKPRRLLQAEKSLEWEISPIGELSDESDIIIPPSQFHMDEEKKEKKYM